MNTQTTTIKAQSPFAGTCFLDGATPANQICVLKISPAGVAQIQSSLGATVDANGNLVVGGALGDIGGFLGGLFGGKQGAQIGNTIGNIGDSVLPGLLSFL